MLLSPSLKKKSRSACFLILTGGHHQAKTGQRSGKILERKAKSRQVGKEKGKYKEELIEKMQE